MLMKLLRLFSSYTDIVSVAISVQLSIQFLLPESQCSMRKLIQCWENENRIWQSHLFSLCWFNHFFDCYQQVVLSLSSVIRQPSSWLWRMKKRCAIYIWFVRQRFEWFSLFEMMSSSLVVIFSFGELSELLIKVWNLTNLFYIIRSHFVCIAVYICIPVA